MPELEKGDDGFFCGANAMPNKQHEPREREDCGAALRRIFESLGQGVVPAPTKPQCVLAMPASLKPTKGQLRFVKAMTSSSASRALLRAFHVVFYGRPESNEYERDLKGKLLAANVSYEITGFVAVKELHKGFCEADGVAVFPLHDRNPRVVYEALQALRPVFVSKEAHVPRATTCAEIILFFLINRRF